MGPRQNKRDTNQGSNINRSVAANGEKEKTIDSNCKAHACGSMLALPSRTSHVALYVHGGALRSGASVHTSMLSMCVHPAIAYSGGAISGLSGSCIHARHV